MSLPLVSGCSLLLSTSGLAGGKDDDAGLVEQETDADTGGGSPDADIHANLDAADGLIDERPCSGPNALALDDRCYFLVTTAQSHSDARAHCAALGAHLVTMTSEEEAIIVQLLAVGSHVWIGLVAPPGTNDRSEFSWITGEPTTIDLWLPDEPNDASGCGAWADAWEDRVCSDQLPAICER